MLQLRRPRSFAFVLPLALGLGLLIAVPEIALFLPKLMWR